MSVRRRVRRRIVSFAVAMILPCALGAQGTARQTHPARAATGSADAGLARARAGTSRYRNQDVAIADGYKPVGVEFPAMGTHWVHLGHVLEDSLIAERPSVLIYVNVGGKAQLAGVAYTDLRTANEPPPVALSPGGWHEHNGTVADESFPLAHDAAGHSTGMLDDPEMRLSVLHAWVWIANPAGVFVTDNWTLPPLRLGIAVPAGTPRDALHALALATDEDRYLLLTLRTGLALSRTEEAAALAVLSEQRALAMTEAAAIRAAGRLTRESSAQLVSRWTTTWLALERALPRRAAALRALRQRLA